MPQGVVLNDQHMDIAMKEEKGRESWMPTFWDERLLLFSYMTE